MTWWEIALRSIPASVPAMGLWLFAKRREEARRVRQTMEYRRRKFGGVVAVTGQPEAKIIERDE